MDLASLKDVRSRTSREPTLGGVKTISSKDNFVDTSKRSQDGDLKATLTIVPGFSKSGFLVSLIGSWMLLWPQLFVWYVLFTMQYFGGSISASWAVVQREYAKGTLYEYLAKRSPGLTVEAMAVYFCWMAFQIVLFLFAPGKRCYGQPMPSGRALEYKCNGLTAWLISHIVVIAAVKFGLFRATILYDNWLSLCLLACVCGLVLTVFVYWKAHVSPNHKEDCRFSGSFIYDIFMGVEHNPRFGKFDFKLFFNGRPGICAWTLINLTFAAKQYERYGFVSNSMIIINVLHALYVVDFFYNEDWYLRTVDIANDHFGFYLAWGDLVWLPFMYTLQAYYLVQHPNLLSNIQVAVILTLGIAGYAIFRLSNNQKEKFRKDMDQFGDSIIWGKPAAYIPAEYKTREGKIRKSPLLASGWWGISRHFNYAADLMGCVAYCAVCGTEHLLPWLYLIYMAILLVHRVYRDNVRCKEKYGHYWDDYCRAVPYKIIPYIF